MLIFQLNANISPLDANFILKNGMLIFYQELNALIFYLNWMLIFISVNWMLMLFYLPKKKNSMCNS